MTAEPALVADTGFFGVLTGCEERAEEAAAGAVEVAVCGVVGFSVGMREEVLPVLGVVADEGTDVVVDVPVPGAFFRAEEMVPPDSGRFATSVML